MALSEEDAVFDTKVEMAEPSGSLLDDVLNRSATRTVAPELTPNVMLGKIADVNSRGIYLLLPMISADPIPAMSVCRITPEQIGQTCAVQFIDNDFSKAIVMGLLIEQKTAILPGASPDNAGPELTVSENETTVKIEAKEQLILQCGESRIIMNANGVIRIRGLYIDSQARATQRIRGGSVRVN